MSKLRSKYRYPDLRGTNIKYFLHPERYWELRGLRINGILYSMRTLMDNLSDVLLFYTPEEKKKYKRKILSVLRAYRKDFEDGRGIDFYYNNLDAKDKEVYEIE